jgi:hypothetical protein
MKEIKGILCKPQKAFMKKKMWVDLRNASKAINSEAERDFQTIGIKQFFDAKNDSNINWNHIFSVEF